MPTSSPSDETRPPTGTADSSPPPSGMERRVVSLAVLTVFLDLIGFGIILPLLPLYVEQMGGSAETVGWLFASFAGTQLVATPILGRLSDRVGRRPVILLSLAGNVLSMVGFALATHFRALPILFASRVMAGATAGNIAACQAAISDVTSERNRAAAMGKIGAGLNLGLICGPIMASALSRRGAWVPPVAAAALALLDFVAALIWMKETRPRERPEGGGRRASVSAWVEARLRALGDRSTQVSLIIYFGIFLCITNVQVALALLAKERLGWGAEQVGWVFGAYAAVSFVVQIALIGRLVRRFGESAVIMLGALTAALGLVLIGEAHDAKALIGATGLLGMGVSLCLPSITAVASKSAAREERGIVLGVLQSSGTLARTLGPPVSGWLYANVAPRAPFLGGAMSALVCLLIAPSLRAGADGMEAGGK